MERETGFEAQGIAGTEAHRHDLGRGEQRLGHRLGLLGRHGDLEPVLAGIAGAADETGHAEDLDRAHVHEPHRRGVGGEAGEHVRRLRPLERDQRIRQQRRIDALGQVRPDPREIGRLVGSVDHDVQPIGQARDHQVVEDAAGLVRQEAVALAPDAEPEDIDRNQCFEGAGRLRDIAGAGRQRDLAHMRDVEEPGGRPRMQVLLEQPGGVLQRHRVARERHHLGAEAQMKCVQRRLCQGLSGNGGGRAHGPGGLQAHRALHDRWILPAGRLASCPHLSRLPESFPHSAERGFSFGGRRSAPLSRLSNDTVIVPESFRGSLLRRRHNPSLRAVWALPYRLYRTAKGSHGANRAATHRRDDHRCMLRKRQ
ncbi:hypothetical protein GCM10025880_36330 [Methylorubrum aminovorans]|nr:hypothetical protein GCM10025880_36330 [Methylorubrum aminovorans]